MDMVPYESSAIVCLALYIETPQCIVKSFDKDSVHGCEPMSKSLGKDLYLLELKKTLYVYIQAWVCPFTCLVNA